MSAPRALLDHKMIVVLGKGGVGRTTVTAALGVAAARLGRRACVVEIGGSGALPARFGLQGASFAFRRAAPGVDVWSLTVPECLEEFAGRKLGLPPFARHIVRNRFVDTFIDAIPGLHDLLLLGKIENLISDPLPGDPRYDLFVLDAPATGHGLTLLQAARTMTEITRTGPFFELSRVIDEFLADRDRTATVVVTLPEALPVAESVELARTLVDEGFAPSAVVANQVEGHTIPDPPGIEAVLDAIAPAPGAENLAALLRTEAARRDRHATALRSLSRQLEELQIGGLIEAPRCDEDVARRVGMALAEVIA